MSIIVMELKDVSHRENYIENSILFFSSVEFGTYLLFTDGFAKKDIFSSHVHSVEGETK